MKVTSATLLAVSAFGIVPQKGKPAPEGERCLACSKPLEGDAIVFKKTPKFNDIFQFADRGGKFTCGACAALLKHTDAMNQSASGVVSAAGFSRLLTNVERFDFLMNPPVPPFAVALINAKQQHVWWMARVAYDRDLIPMHFGHRALIIDRPRSIAAANAIMEFEEMSIAMSPKRKCTYVFPPLSRDLRAVSDGQYTISFMKDDGNAAIALRDQLRHLTLGDLWATMQLRAECRNMGVSHTNHVPAARKTRGLAAEAHATVKAAAAAQTLENAAAT